MSELKEYLCVEAFIPYTKEIPGYLFKCAKYRAPQAEMELVYLKSEADKVIAEKDTEIEELKKQVHDYAQGLYVIQAMAENEARHQKYKRCLAMAKWCDVIHENYELLADDAYRRSCFNLESRWNKASDKWLKRKNKWLAIANKYKEAK